MEGKILLSIFITLLLIPIVFATQTTLGTYERGACIELTQICGDCVWNNVTSILFPNTTKVIIDGVMTKRGTDYNYSYCFPNETGDYYINGVGDYFGDDKPIIWEYIVTLTPTGNEKLNSGEGLSLLGSILVMIVLGLFFFLMSFKFEGKTGKIICIGLAGIIFFIAVLYTLMILNQNFGGFSQFTEGYATFWMVLKVFGGVIILFFVLYCFLLAFKLWGIKRGFIDVD